MDITPLLSYLSSTSNVALSCKEFAWRVRSNGFPIRTSEAELCPENLSLYKLLDYPNLDQWTINKISNMIKTNDCDRLLLLLESGANIDAKNNFGGTALIWAAWDGKVECLKILLQYKANIEAKTQNRWTALIWAVRFGRTDCLKVLLQHEADIEAKDEYGHTVLIWTARYGKTECLEILLQHGAKVDPELRERFPQYAELWPDSTL